MTAREPLNTQYQQTTDAAITRVAAQTPQLNTVRRSITPAMAQRAASIARALPEGSPQFVTATIMAGLNEHQIDTPVFAELKKRDAAANDRNWFGIEPMVRNLDFVFESLWQAKQQNERTILGLFQGKTWGQAWEESGTTYFDELITQARLGNPIDIGSGWTVQSTLPQDQPGYYEEVQQLIRQGLSPEEARRQADLKATAQYGIPLSQVVGLENEAATGPIYTLRDGTQYSTPYSLGRFIAGKFVPPDSRPYQVMSSLIDGYNRIFGDPSNVPLNELALWKASKGRFLPQKGSEALRAAYDDWLFEHNIIANPESFGLFAEELGYNKGDLLGMKIDPAMVDDQGKVLGIDWPQKPEDLQPVVIFRDAIERSLKDLDSADPNAHLGLETIIMNDGGDPLPRTFENVAHIYGDDVAEWQVGKYESPYTQAAADLGLTNADMREQVYLKGGPQVYEDFVMEHELVHAELQAEKAAEINRVAQTDINKATEMAYRLEYEAETEALKRFLGDNMSTAKYRQQAYRDAGLTRWWRPWVKTQTFDDYLRSEEGRKIIQFVSDSDSMQEIDDVFGQLPAEARRALVDADDPAKVIEILTNYGGGPRMPRAPQLSRRQKWSGLAKQASDRGPISNAIADLRQYSPVARTTRRWIAQSGDMVLDPHEIDGSMSAAKNWLYTVMASRQEVDDIMYRIAGVNGSMGELSIIWDDMIQIFARRMDQLGYNSDEIAIIMDDFAKKNYAARLYFDNLAGQNQLLYQQGRYVGRDGIQMQALSGHLPSEFSHNFIVMPNMRDTRRASNSMRATIQKVRRHYPESWWRGKNIKDPLGTNPNFLAKLLDPAMSLWRNSALLRIGWPLRVLPEEMIRMQAAGYTQVLRHPFSYLALVFSDSKGGFGLLGDDLNDVFTAKALGSGAFQVDWTNTIRGTAFDASNASWGVVRFGEQGYNVGVAREILDLWGAEVSRKVSVEGVDAAFDWLRNTPEGQKYLNDVVNQASANSVWKKTVPNWGMDQDQADTVLHSVLQSIDARIEKNTGGRYVARQIDPQTSQPTGKWVDDYDQVIPLDAYDNMKNAELYAELQKRQIGGHSRSTKPEMIDALLRDDGYGALIDADPNQFFITVKDGDQRVRQLIGTGELNGETKIWPQMNDVEQRTFENSVLDAYTSEDFMPEMVKIPDERQSRNLSQAYDKVTDGLFNVLMGVPTRKLVRSPFARIRYTEEVARGYIFATDVERAKILKFIDDNNMRTIFDDLLDKQLLELNLKGLPPQVDDAFSFDEIDRMAKAVAIEDTKELFYDLSQRGNWSDATRLIFPFADAWWEVISRWAKFLDPTGLVPGRKAGQEFQALRNTRKAQVIVRGARESGFFSTDKFDNEVFNWPGFGLLVGDEGGVGFGSTTSLESLMFIDPTIRGILAPGTGPLAQIVGWKLIPKMPTQYQDFMNEAVYGEFEPPSIDNIHDLALTMAPTWMRRLSEKLWPNYRQVYADEITGLLSATYLSNNPMWGDAAYASAQERLEWSQSQGSWLAFLRIIDGVISPSQPHYEPKVLIDSMKSGDNQTWVSVQALADEYRVAREFYQNDVAAAMYMLENFGVDALNIVPETTTIYQRPSTGDAYMFVEDHAWMRKAAPFTLMAWVGLDDADEFSYTAFNRQFQIDEGTGGPARQKTTPEMAARYLNQAKGYRAWNNVLTQYDTMLEQAKAQAGGNDKTLSAYREQLNLWKAEQRDAIHAAYWAWGNDRGSDLPLAYNRPSYRVLFDEMADLPSKPDMVALSPELADWITFTTDLWRYAEKQSVERGSDLDWWRTSEPQNGGPQAIRDWFTQGVEQKAQELTDPVAIKGADWYMKYVVSRLLNGVEWDDVLWFEMEQAPKLGEGRTFSYDQLQQFDQLPGNQTQPPEWQQSYEQRIGTP